MNTLLQLDTSLFSDRGQSSQLAARFVKEWQLANPRATVISRDLARDPLPHLSAARFQAFITKPEERTPAQVAHARESDALIDELKQADTIVIGLPMYNFGIPSTLKAYFDHVARVGHTFRYTETGPEGLLKGKRAVIFAARGGIYAGTPLDTQTAYVRDFLRFLGIEEVEFVYAEGLALGEDAKGRGLAKAHEAIRTLTAPLAVAA